MKSVESDAARLADEQEAQEFAALMHEKFCGPLTEHDLAVLEKRYFPAKTVPTNEGEF